MTPVATHNRLPVPDCVVSDHFCYAGRPQKLASEDVSAVMRGVTAYIQEHGIGAAEILLLSARHLRDFAGAESAEAFERLAAQLGHRPEDAQPVVLACEWASPHVDESYAGQAFCSLVLHTGPEPYVLQLLETSVGPDGVSRVKATTRVLTPGDVVVIDPTTPHMAMPLHSHSESLLVMLQLELPDTCPAEREAVLRRFPPRADDRDHETALYFG